MPNISRSRISITVLRRSRSQVAILSAKEKCKLFFVVYWRTMVFFCCPILFLPLLFLGEDKDFKCVYIVLLMGTFWATETFPMPITAMIPIVLFPLMGIMDTQKTCKQYFHGGVAFFACGAYMAASIRISNLHHRVALVILNTVGAGLRRLHAGIVCTTIFISMWMSNLAATAIICPVMKGILEELEGYGMCDMYELRDDISVEEVVIEIDEEEEPEYRKTDFDMTVLNRRQKCSLFCKLYWRTIIFFISPIVLLPIILCSDRNQEVRCAYVVSVMAIYWATETIPMPITAMIPIVFFPLFGIMDTAGTCKQYFHSAVAFFACGSFTACAIRLSGLNQRIALMMLSNTGFSLKRVHIAVICLTSFISMWMSNVATTAMVCPIAKGILDEFEKQGLCELYNVRDDIEIEEVEVEVNEDELEDYRKINFEIMRPSNITNGFFIAIAYSSSLGGLSTLMGNICNAIMRGFFQSFFPASPGFSFREFSEFSSPVVITGGIFLVLYFQCMFFGLFRPNSKEARAYLRGEEGKAIAARVIKARYNELGPVTMHEILVATGLVCSVLIFFFRNPGMLAGLPEEEEIADATPGMMIIILFFCIPSVWSCFKFCKTNKRSELPSVRPPRVLNWKTINSTGPWGVFLLLGGGYALAEGSRKSGMTKLIADDFFTKLENLPPIIVLATVVATTSFFTEMCANTPTANMLIPAISQMAVRLRLHPLYVMIPAGLACSMSFLLPVATPANAFINGYVGVLTRDLARYGIVLKIFMIISITLGGHYWGPVVFPDLRTFPSWANTTNFSDTRIFYPAF